MVSFSGKRATGFALLAFSGLLLVTGCGSSMQSSASSPGSSSSQSSTPSSHAAKPHHKHGAKAGAKTRVALVEANKSAQVLAAAPAKSSSANEAVFTLTAYNAKGKPVKGAKVSYFIGPMKPLSNIGPAAWYRSGTPGAKAYIANFSKLTNSAGQATVTLYGQPADTMEMVGVRIGNLNSFDKPAKRAIGTLDAWWTNSQSGGAPVGDYVTAAPFMAAGAANKSKTVTVTAMSKTGPIPGAAVQYIVESGSSGGMGSSGSMSSSSSSGSMSKTTNAQGHATFTVTPGKAGKLPVRIVVTQPSGTARVAGGMNILLFARKGHAASGSSSSM
ncbi:MAG: hypothetical protein ACYCYO_16650 [Bacilli bacterium]